MRMGTRIVIVRRVRTLSLGEEVLQTFERVGVADRRRAVSVYIVWRGRREEEDQHHHDQSAIPYIPE
jgi:hypothetical protein